MTTSDDKGWLEVNLEKPAEATIETVVEEDSVPATAATTEEQKPEESPSKGVDRRIRKALERATAAERLAAEKDAALAAMQEQLNAQAATATRRETAAVSTFRQGVEAKLKAAEKAFADAYKSGDDQALIAAQREMNRAEMDLYNLETWKSTQATEAAKPAEVKVQQVQQQLAPEIPDAAKDWIQANPWFGAGPKGDLIATRTAAAISDSLVAEGYDPADAEFYEEVSKRLLEELPRAARLMKQDSQQPEPRKQQLRSPVAAPSRRAVPSGKVRIDESQAAMASRLGLSVEDYAVQQHRLDSVKDDAGYTPILINRK